MVGKLFSVLVSTAILSGLSCAPVKLTNRAQGDSIFGNVSSDKLVEFISFFVLKLINLIAIVIMHLTLNFLDYVHADLRLLARASG